ncbi:MAG: dCTP deaminase [Candidatus Gracilibacteria bacterium]
MILSDSEIRKRLKNGEIGMVSHGNYDINEQVGPASLDFRLGNTFKIYRTNKLTYIDSKKGVGIDNVEIVTRKDGERFILHPGDFVLGTTLETIKVPYDLVARCEGRSSIGRLGVIIHSTAGFVDPGFEGTITLEMTNINELPIVLYPGMRIGQYAFETILGTVENTYDKRKGSKYMNQVLPEESRIFKDLY